MDKLLEIATKEKLCDGNIREHQTFISLKFTNKSRLPTRMFNVM